MVPGSGKLLQRIRKAADTPGRNPSEKRQKADHVRDSHRKLSERQSSDVYAEQDPYAE